MILFGSNELDEQKYCLNIINWILFNSNKLEIIGCEPLWNGGHKFESFSSYPCVDMSKIIIIIIILISKVGCLKISLNFKMIDEGQTDISNL